MRLSASMSLFQTLSKPRSLPFPSQTPTSTSWYLVRGTIDILDMEGQAPQTPSTFHCAFTDWFVDSIIVGYLARTDKELPVLCRWFPVSPDTATISILCPQFTECGITCSIVFCAAEDVFPRKFGIGDLEGLFEHLIDLGRVGAERVGAGGPVV